MSDPLIEDIALTMRSAIARALGEPDARSAVGLLGEIDLGLQAITALTTSPTEPGGALDLASAPRPHVLVSGTIPPAGPGAFEDYLRLRTGDAALRLVAVERISGGFSRDMIRLRCASGDVAQDIVLRREVPDGLLDGIGIDVASEYPFMQAAAAGGVPMASPRWLELDPTVLGQPFVAMDCAAGECLGTALGAAHKIGDGQLRALAGVLARLHRSEWRQLAHAAAAAATPAAAATALLDRWQAYWHANALSPQPLLDRAMAWLRDHLPERGLPPCLTHGDVGFHNIMGDDRGFTALLDWEMAVIASPAKDLAHVRPSVENMVDWGQFTSWYQEAGGAVIDPAELHWFEVLRAFSMTLVCHVALAKLRIPRVARIDYFRLAFPALPVFADQLVTLLQASYANRPEL